MAVFGAVVLPAVRYPCKFRVEYCLCIQHHPHAEKRPHDGISAALSRLPEYQLVLPRPLRSTAMPKLSQLGPRCQME